MTDTSKEEIPSDSSQNNTTFLSWFLKTLGWSAHALIFWGFGTFLALIIFRNSWKNSSGFFPAFWSLLMQFLMPVVWILYIICFFIYKWWVQCGFDYDMSLLENSNLLYMLKVDNAGIGTSSYSALLALIIPLIAVLTGYIYIENISSSLYSYLPENPFTGKTQEKKKE